MPPTLEMMHATAPFAGQVMWLTGLSGAGKTTIACALEAVLRRQTDQVKRIDGDELRLTVSANLGYSVTDRSENVRRAAVLAARFANEGAVCIVALISPLRAQRAEARRLVGTHRFLEVHVATPLVVCRARDPKGLYARADRGELPDFTGVSAPYEEPLAPDVVLRTESEALDQCALRLLRALRRASVVNAD